MAGVLGLKSAPRREGSTHPASTSYAWRIVAWFGLLFLLISLADMALVWYPLRRGNPAWEFGAIDLMFSSLPVLTIGYAALLGSAFALGRYTRATVYGTLGVLLGLGFLAAFLVFLTDVPLALRNSPDQVLTGVKKAVFRNTVFGVCFPIAFLASGIGAIRHARRARRGTAAG